MKLYSFLNSKDEVLTVVGPTDTVPPVESCQGAARVAEGDLIVKGAKRAQIISNEIPEVSQDTMSELIALKQEVANLKLRLEITETKQMSLEQAKG